MKIRVVTEDIPRTRAPIRYSGNVEVIGRIRSGAHIEIEGDLEVFGSVEDARIIAGGSVFVEGGFLGVGRGSITCGGTFEARFVQNQRVDAKGDVRIVKSLISSHVLSSSSVTVGDKNEGSIIGGQINAYGKVEAAVIGSRRPVTTKVAVGLDPVVAMEISEMEHEAMELTKKRVRFIKDLGSMLDDNAERGASEEAADMKAAADAIQADITILGMEIVELRQTTQSNPHGTVVVRQRSHSPLEVSICSSKIISERQTGPVVFRLFDDQVILDKWSPDHGNRS
jgi:uncharacterized protein (DUF342 family)